MEGSANTIEAGLSKLGSAKPHALSSSKESLSRYRSKPAFASLVKGLKRRRKREY